jgi:hypothetical protein|tara:strand:- start:183 stop:584 length:402 start_codon:yes stop_codon:yes gene_type:complete
MTEAEAAYIAGLFDGEGTITYKKYKEKKSKGTYDCWRISMEIAMTDRSVLVWLTEVLGCGTLNKKPRKNGHKMQYRWRCVFRDCFHVCCILFPFAHVKLGKIQQVIEHYSTIQKKDNVVDLNHYKMWISDRQQ